MPFGTAFDIVSGTAAQRPAAGVAGRYFCITDGDFRRLYHDDGTNWEYVGLLFSRFFSLEDPGASEKAPWFRTPHKMTAIQVRAAILGGASTPTVTCDVMKHDAASSDFDNAGTSLLTGTITTTDGIGAAGTLHATNKIISADRHVWVKTTAQGGTTPWLHVTLDAILHETDA